MEIITSRQNPICTHFRKLASSRAYREETGEMLCDSPKLLREAELWGQGIRTILYTEGTDIFPFKPEDTCVRVIQVTESVMESVSPMKTPREWSSPAPPCCTVPLRSWSPGGIWCWTGSRTPETWAPFCARQTPLTAARFFSFPAALT